MASVRGVSGLALRLAVTIGLLGVLLFVVADPREIGTLLADAAPLPLIAAVALCALDRVTMAYKWWLLLRARRLSVSLWVTIRSYFASSLYGLMLPVTVGADAVRILALRHLGLLDVTASIVIERGLGVIAMGSVALLSCVLLATTVTTYAVQSLTTWLVVATTVTGGLFVVSLLAADRVATRWVNAPPKVRQAAEAYGTYRHAPGVLAVFYSLSVLESLLSAVIAYVVAIALGIPLPMYLLLATVPIALASARLPVSLGGFGVQEASFVFLAGLVEVPNTHAFAIFLVVDAAMLIALLPSVLDGSMLTLRHQAAETRVL